MSTFVRKLMILVSMILEVHGDIYLHTPRGSNNRLNENGRGRAKANRLFDSQNNNRGGYNVGPQPMYYYAGSKLQIQWTNQHSCSDKNSHCELIIQYMCGPNIRDGTSTDTIPVDKAKCANADCNTDEKYGMHEDSTHYQRCLYRKRNLGLFTADQNMEGKNKQSAASTRQENNGRNNRYGYECTEERDYYPYWHPSPWKDIAVLTNTVGRCAHYKAESENVKSRWQCVLPLDTLEKMDAANVYAPNNAQDCANFKFPANDPQGVKGEWKESSAHGIPSPDCHETLYSRDNHLGNGVDGYANRYNWTLPDIDQGKCVLRIRYNISTNDYDGWNTDSTKNPDKNGDPTKLDLSAKFGFSNSTEAAKRGYVFKGNPAVKIFDEGNFDFQLAIDTSQFGRTFQDRSHTFSIRRRPDSLKTATIHNINVSGKRGNIVQVYPAVEYDFVPNILEMRPGDFVHFQWTGSDTNPNNNDGQGKAGSDRNNVLLLRDKNYPEGTGVQYGPAPTFGHFGNNYPKNISDSQFLGLTKDDLLKLAFLNTDIKVGPNLDEASPYFDLGPRQITQLGTYHYVSTRNNNFSNRDQKGRIMVTDVVFIDDAIGRLGGEVVLPDGFGRVQVDPGVFDGLTMLRLEVWSRSKHKVKVDQISKSLTAGEKFASDFLIMHPESVLTQPGKVIKVTLTVDTDKSNIAIYRSSETTGFSVWTKIEADIMGDMAHFKTQSGGVYVAKSHSHTVLIVALVLSLLVVVLVIVGGICYFRKNPNKWKKLKKSPKNLQDRI
ncbi:protein DD3-3-like isoform X2 [Dreissena polymorpha]|nr:protein DD3-3-like isoform X1 [Dreissena polymorpha]XP_052266869.1 protein DD3-3-like isoform X2 [Dreissena polymorpha]